MTSSISDLIRNRRTIHQFISSRLPPREEILAAIEHATWAPNHHLTEPWRYYLIGAQTKEALCRLNAELLRAKRGDRAADVKLKRWLEIPGWLVQTCTVSGNEIRDREDYAACCCGAQNLMLYLWSRGIGCKWTTGGITRDPECYRLLNIDPARELITGLFWYGYPDEQPQAMRKPVTEILTEVD